jgi:signal transduction histidine kinase
MKTFITVLFIFLSMSQLQAQNTKIDSLDRLISKSTTDTARINLIIQKISLISRVNIDSAISLAKKTVEDAKIINYKKGEAAARGKLATNYNMKGEYQQAAENIAIAKNIYDSLKDSLGLSNTWSNYGMMYGMQSKYDTSIQYYEIAIGIAERNNYNDKLPGDYGNIAIGYQMRSDFSQALRYQQKSLTLAKAANDLNDQAYVSLNMGLTYFAMGDTARAEQFYIQSISLAKSTGAKNVELYAYSNLANLYAQKKQREKAYDYAIKAATLGKEMGDQGIQAASLSKAAEALSDMKRFAEAETLARQAISIADSSAQPLNIYQAYSAMGAILKKQEKYKDAIPYLEKSIATMGNSDIYNEAVGLTNYDLSLCYEKTGNYGKALTVYRTASQIVDSVRSRENIRRATEINMNYEYEKKQEAQRIEQKQKDAVTKERQIALLVGLGLTLILAIVAFSAFRNKQKANAVLKQQKQEIQSTLSKLEATQKQLIQSEKMASLGELTAGIAHEIQNPLNFVNNFSDVNAELIDEMQTELKAGNSNEAITISNNIKENQEKITHHGKRADAIVKGMLQHSRSSSGVKEPTDINALADEYLRLAYHGLRAKDKSFNATMKTDFDETIGNINIIPQDIGRVILNLITNAFYAVSAKASAAADAAPLPSRSEFGTGSEGGFRNPQIKHEPTIWVSTKKDGNKVLISVRDNGPGIPQKILDKIFQPFFTTKPTGQGTGLGLSLSYDIVKAHGGELRVETPPAGEAGKEGEGAEFIIQLPL